MYLILFYPKSSKSLKFQKENWKIPTSVDYLHTYSYTLQHYINGTTLQFYWICLPWTWKSSSKAST